MSADDAGDNMGFARSAGLKQGQRGTIRPSNLYPDIPARPRGGGGGGGNGGGMMMGNGDPGLGTGRGGGGGGRGGRGGATMSRQPRNMGPGAMASNYPSWPQQQQPQQPYPGGGGGGGYGHPQQPPYQTQPYQYPPGYSGGGGGGGPGYGPGSQGIYPGSPPTPPPPSAPPQPMMMPGRGSPYPPPPRSGPPGPRGMVPHSLYPQQQQQTPQTPPAPTAYYSPPKPGSGGQLQQFGSGYAGYESPATPTATDIHDYYSTAPPSSGDVGGGGGDTDSAGGGGTPMETSGGLTGPQAAMTGGMDAMHALQVDAQNAYNSVASKPSGLIIPGVADVDSVTRADLQLAMQQIQKLQETFGATEGRITALEKATKAIGDMSKTFYALVKTPSDGSQFLLLYNAPPATATGIGESQARGKVRGGRWLKLCHPKVVRKDRSWWRVLLVDPKTGDTNSLWVPDRDDHKNPVFSSYSMTPGESTSAPKPEAPPAAEMSTY